LLFLGEFIKRSGSLRTVVDEFLVEAPKPIEGSDFSYILWDRPIEDSFNFYWVHFDLVFADDHSTKIDFGLFE